jgi:hypothetical protein
MLKQFVVVSVTLLLAGSGMSAGSSDPSRKSAHEPVPVRGPFASVTGIVRNNRDKVVPDTLVRFVRQRGAHATYQRRTNADGTFAIDLPPGVFHILAAHRGEGRSSTRVNFTANQAINLEISLQKPGWYPWRHRSFHLGTRLPHKT